MKQKDVGKRLAGLKEEVVFTFSRVFVTELEQSRDGIVGLNVLGSSQGLHDCHYHVVDGSDHFNWCVCMYVCEKESECVCVCVLVHVDMYIHCKIVC